LIDLFFSLPFPELQAGVSSLEKFWIDLEDGEILVYSFSFFLSNELSII
jgi:hypothetical protein